jgi:hypothetical protein
MIRAAACLACIAAPAAAADYEFCWFGSNGFLIEGRMTIAEDATSNTHVTEHDVTAFSIIGTRNGVAIGHWSMTDLTPLTSWNLNFDTGTLAFITGGYSTSDEGQQWNASGSVNDCGEPGFGFNSGASGQDVCVKNTYRTDSTVPADTPLPAYPHGTGPACTSAPLFGSLMHPSTPLTPAALR